MEPCGAPEGDFTAFLGRALQNFSDELCQAYRSSLSEHISERRRLTDQVARLQAELLAAAETSVSTLSPAPAPAPAPPPLMPPEDDAPSADKGVVAQPPPAARMLPFLLAKEAHVHEPMLGAALGAEVQAALMPTPSFAPSVFQKKASSHRVDVDTQAYLKSKSKRSSDWGSVQGPSHRNDGDGQMYLQSKSKRSSDWGSVQGRRPSFLSVNESLQHVYHRRLQARLAHLRSKGAASGADLHQMMSALGLEKYSVKEMQNLVVHIGTAIRLRIKDEFVHASPKRSANSMTMLHTDSDPAEWMEWRWPEATDVDGLGVSIPMHWSGLSSVSLNTDEEQCEVLPLRVLMELFFKPEGYLEKLLGPALTDQVFAMREVLLTGEANRLISELTNVKIDHLAIRRRRLDRILLMDVAVGTMILANGLELGVQTDAKFVGWNGWPRMQVFFTCFFVLEIAIRQHLEGRWNYFCGPERFWNALDMFLVALGALDTVLSIIGTSFGPYPIVLRFIRVARLSRLVRIFRLTFMLELRLMVKGVLSGIRTLFWAFVLLTFVLYGLGIVSVTVFTRSSDPIVQELFQTVPASMFTTFRCMVGDCQTKSGDSLTAALFDEFGSPFALCFVAIYMLITMGLFNVILAIYVDITMVAAKQTEDANKGRDERDAIRVAQMTKRLLKTFCAAFQVYKDLASSDKQAVDLQERLASTKEIDTEIDDDISISKELYLLVIRIPEVKQLMDDLDIPPDRVNLFDSIDADGSGQLQATELVRGFLKVRGQVSTDNIACLLVLRSIQGTLRGMGEDLDMQKRMLMEHLQEGHKPGRVTTKDL